MQTGGKDVGIYWREGADAWFEAGDVGVRVWLEREGGGNGGLLDLRGDERKTPNEGHEVDKAVVHVGGLEGETVCGGEQGVGFVRRRRNIRDGRAEPSESVKAVSDRGGEVGTVGADAVEVRGTETEDGVHQVGVVGGDEGDLHGPG